MEQWCSCESVMKEYTEGGHWFKEACIFKPYISEFIQIKSYLLTFAGCNKKKSWRQERNATSQY